MTNPDSLVESSGRAVELIRVTDAVFDDMDEFDSEASTIEAININAIISNPSEEDQQRLQGREATASKRITVKSSVDIDPSRSGRSDRVRVPEIGNDPGDDPDSETLFKTVEIIEDQHPFTGVVKTQVLLEHLPGRG